jgi:hypothetical protein
MNNKQVPWLDNISVNILEILRAAWQLEEKSIMSLEIKKFELFCKFSFISLSNIQGKLQAIVERSPENN